MGRGNDRKHLREALQSSSNCQDKQLQYKGKVSLRPEGGYRTRACTIHKFDVRMSNTLAGVRSLNIRFQSTMMVQGGENG
jgi:hypothetical protein